ncbi:hypothetical protein [Fibrella aquatica]|uniref:hypothetical protein n=1 Tax=Fibrella aquatica TaxID=3242487 RepID=UPI00351FD4CD
MRFLNTLLLWLLLLSSSLGQKQTAPRPQGNWFPFTEQLAKNTLLASRFPSGWTNPANRVFIMGFGVPFTANVAENNRRFTNAGFTHMERDVIVNRLNLPVSKRYRMMTDADAKNMATAWANTLADGDPKKAPLLAYGNDRSITSTDWSLWQELGKRVYLSARGPGLGLVGFDIEVFADNTSEYLRHEFQVAANLGVTQGIAETGDPAKFFQYGGSLADVVNYIKNRQDNDIYMRIPGPDWRGAGGLFDPDASTLATYYRTSGAFVGRDQYARRTWDDRTLWQKNGDGSIKLDNAGNPLHVKANYPTEKVQNFGVNSTVHTYEPLYWYQMWYEEAEKVLCDWRWKCNTPISYDGLQVVGQMPYPKGTVDLRAAIANLKLCGWYRDDTESEQMWNPDLNGGNGAAEFVGEAEGNRRPLNPRSTRFQLLIRSLLYHGNILWSDKAYKDFVQGQAFSAEEGGQMVPKPALSMGQYEMMIAGNFQAKNFPRFFELMDQNKIEFIIPKRFIYKGNVSVGEREVEKPIVWLMKEQAGRRLFGLWVWPVQDVNNPLHERDITCWIELDNGQKSGSWILRCKDRNAAFDAWTMPAGFETAKPENFRFQFTSLLGQKFTWTGSYNVSFSGANPTPPAPITRTLIN